MPCPKYPVNPTPVEYMHTEKGSVHWFDFEANNNYISSHKARPYIIIGRNNPKSRRVIICPVSNIKHYLEEGTTKLKYPYHAPLYKKDYPFLEVDSAVLLDQVYTVSKDELCQEWYMGKVDDCGSIDQAIMYNYDLFDSIRQAYNELLKQVNEMHQAKYTRK